MIHYRFICPVGQGGFVFEKFENISVIFDCGSDNCKDRVFQYIDAIKNNGVSQIDYLFVSHFDNDHVDCIGKLLSTLQVKEAVVPHIPNDYRIAYNLYTNNAYSRVMDILRDKEMRFSEISEDTTVHIEQDIWEWIAHNQIEAGDWTTLRNEMTGCGIDTELLSDPVYIENKKEDINNCFKEAFGSKGPNTKGLMMLSQSTTNASVDNSRLFTCKRVYKHLSHPYFPYSHCIIDEFIDCKLLDNSNYTGALYTGDADLKSCKYTNLAKNFYDNRKSEDKLVLCQIPHPGSRYNSTVSLSANFPSQYYFYHDCSDARIKKNEQLFGQLTKNNQLLGLHNIESDIVYGVIELH